MLSRVGILSVNKQLGFFLWNKPRAKADVQTPAITAYTSSRAILNSFMADFWAPVRDK